MKNHFFYVGEKNPLKHFIKTFRKCVKKSFNIWFDASFFALFNGEFADLYAVPIKTYSKNACDHLSLIWTS